MRRHRWIAVFVTTVAVAACSGDAAEVTTSRAVLSPIVTTTTRSAETPTPDTADLPAVETSSVTAGPVVHDPIPAGAARPVRAAAGRSDRGEPQPTGHIDIPAIGLSHPTYEGIDLATINHGPSHWPGTALPGERGNTVFPGHRTTYSRPFWDIDKLARGDHVVFTTPAGRFTYRVTETFVVGERETWIAKPTEGATFTIFACHPKGSARQRYVAKGELVSPAHTTTTTPTTTTTTTTTTSTTSTPTEDQSPGVLPRLPG
jgi:sortase A